MRIRFSLLAWSFAAFVVPYAGHAEPGVETGIAYFTDAEGSYDKLMDFLAHNENFEKRQDGKYYLKAGHHHFVFGGDAPDRDSGSVRVVRELMRIKGDAGERVAFIIGNRDANKTGLKWSMTNGRFPDEVKTNPQKLRYLFGRMNAPSAFDHHRTEMATITGGTPESITDEAVAENYLKALGPDGEFTRFLEAGKLAHRIGCTLFVHSGIPVEALGHMPNQEGKIADVPTWIAKLNAWYDGEIADWKKGGKAEKLGDYARPAVGSKQNSKSIVYGKTTDQFNNPQLPDVAVIEALIAAGIKRIVVGHTPMGGVPAVLRYGDRFEMVWGDNSYAPHASRAPQIDFSGPDFDTTTITAKAEGNFSKVPGNVTIRTKLGEATPIGRHLPDGSLILGRVGNEYLTLKLGDNFAMDYALRKASEIRAATGPCKELEGLGG